MMILLLVLTTVVAAVRGLWSPCGLSMLSALNPIAERARGHRFWVTALWYVAGAVAGGAVLGGALAGGAALVRLADSPPAPPSRSPRTCGCSVGSCPTTRGRWTSAG